MKYFPHLKVEFRAVEYGASHVLEYRINPDQDLKYKDEISIFGLFKFNVKRKFKTNWIQAWCFSNYPSAYLYSKESGEPYLPIFIENKKELNWYKEKFKTIGEFIDYKHKLDEDEESKWIVDRTNYLNNKETWY